MPLSSMKKTVLTVAVVLWPSWIIPYSLAIFIERSAMTGNGMSTPIFSFIACIQARCAETLSTDSPDELDVHRFQFLIHCCKCKELGRAYRCEVSGVRERHHPFPLEIRELQRPLGRFGAEIRCRLSQYRHSSRPISPHIWPFTLFHHFIKLGFAVHVCRHPRKEECHTKCFFDLLFSDPQFGSPSNCA